MSQRAVLPHVALITNTDLLIWDTAVLCYIEQLEGTSMRKYLLQRKAMMLKIYTKCWIDSI